MTLTAEGIQNIENLGRHWNVWDPAGNCHRDLGIAGYAGISIKGHGPYAPACPDSASKDLMQIDTALPTLCALARQALESDKAASYPSHFEYHNYEIGDDDVLRVGDYINCNHQRGHDGHEENLEGKIVLHHDTGVPVFLYNIENGDEENSGDYADFQSLSMHCWTFARIKASTKGEE